MQLCYIVTKNYVWQHFLNNPTFFKVWNTKDIKKKKLWQKKTKNISMNSDKCGCYSGFKTCRRISLQLCNFVFKLFYLLITTFSDSTSNPTNQPTNPPPTHQHQYQHTHPNLNLGHNLRYGETLLQHICINISPKKKTNKQEQHEVFL